jgi:hypothetical protein
MVFGCSLALDLEYIICGDPGNRNLTWAKEPAVIHHHSQSAVFTKSKTS